jgi:tetratricopeptide (TPR) repeat protein
LYYSQGKYDEAEPLYVECLALRKAILGTSHRNTLISMNNLAGLYRRQGKYDQAKEIRANT